MAVDELVVEIILRMSPVELAMLEAIGFVLPPHLSRLANPSESVSSVDPVRKWIAFNSAWLQKEFARQERLASDRRLVRRSSRRAA